MYCNFMLDFKRTDDVIVFLNISYLTSSPTCLIETLFYGQHLSYFIRTRRYRIVVVVLQIVTQFSTVGDY
jgi:hypothetical protein